MTTYTVLCVGGPKDGQWVTVDDRTFMVAEMPKLTFSADDTDAVTEPFVRHQYHVEAVPLIGHRLHVAICHGQFQGSRERETAIMRAVLQRDVAAQMGVL